MTAAVGKAMRLKRVIDPKGVSVICALDHGMTSPSFLEPLLGHRRPHRRGGAGRGERHHDVQGHDPRRRARLLTHDFARPAAVRLRQPEGSQPAVVQVAEVEEAARLGADAVVLFTALSGGSEPGMIRTLAGVGRECASLGVPLIAEAEFPTTYASVEELTEQYGFGYLQRNVRLCAELGADIVKTNWPGDAESFGRLVAAANGCPGGAGRRLTPDRPGAARADGGGHGHGGDRLLGRPEHLHARLARGHHPGAVQGDQGAVDGGQGGTGARGRAGPGSGRMKAAFMTGVDAAEVRESAEPALEPGGAILRVEACGICGTDARTFFNGDPRAPAPWVLGPRAGGDPEQVGPAAVLPPGMKEGDRVFLGSILTCGECRWCGDGFQNMCDHHLLYGYDPFPGAYAEYAAVPPIATKNLIALPPDLPSDLATVADPFACALNGIEQLDVGLGDTVVIIGAGPIGCWQAVMARDRGAGRVLLTDVNQAAPELALQVVGAFVDDAWVAGDDNGVAEALSRTGGAGAERVSVAAPSKQAQRAALEIAAKRARIVYFAGLPKHDPVSSLDINQLHYKELVVLGAYGATRRQYRLTMDYLNRRRDELGAVVTHRFPLAQIAEAFGTIRSGAGLKMVILP
jgi:L-iditol 2-dehydrogenase